MYWKLENFCYHSFLTFLAFRETTYMSKGISVEKMTMNIDVHGGHAFRRSIYYLILEI